MTHKRTTEFRTSCKDCIFCEYDENTDGSLIQIGCDFNRLEKYKEKDKAELVIDEDKGYYEIKTFCNTCRNQEWVEQLVEKDLTKEELKDKVKKDISSQFDVILLFYSPNPSFGRNRKLAEVDIESSVEKVVNQTIKPNKVIVAVYDEGLNYQKLYAKIDKHFKKNKIKYELTKVLYDNLNERAVIDQAEKRCDGRYYSIFKVGYNIPYNFIEKLNNVLNVELNPFSCLTTEDLNGLTVQRRVHKMVGGNKATKYQEDEKIYFKVEEKIAKLAEEQDVNHMIREFEDL